MAGTEGERMTLRESQRRMGTGLLSSPQAKVESEAASL